MTEPSNHALSKLRQHALRLAAEGASTDGVAEIAHLAGIPEERVRSGISSAFEGIGTLDSHVVVLALPIEDVKRLLPAGLELAPQIVTPLGKHPVFVLLSHDHFDAWFGDMDYHELMVGVPYTQLRETSAPNRGPFIYMPRLYLDQAIPRILGNRLYGFEKLPGEIDASETAYTVREPGGGATIVRAELSDTGTAAAPAEFANFDLVRQLFEQPTVSQALRIVDPDAFHARDAGGPFLCSTVTYAFGDPRASLQPSRIRLEVTEQLTPAGILAGTYEREGIDVAQLGSFHLKVPQVVSLPGTCAETRYAAAPGKRRHVVVLGAGPAACAAAFYLARQKERFRVSMYTRGWRMGGKCAAGRNPDAADRIEEHGLHAFVGFYENAFRTVREVYDVAGIPLEVGTPPYDYARGEGPFAGAFVGAADVGVMDRWKGQWRYFATPQTFNGKVPGGVPAGGEDHPHGYGPTILGTLGRVVTDLRALLQGRDDPAARLEQHVREQEEGSRWKTLFAEVEAVIGWEARIDRLLRQLVDYLERLAVNEIEEGIERGGPLFRGLSVLLGLVRSGLKLAYRDEIDQDPQAWFMWSSLDVFLTVLIGIIDSRTVDFDELDDLDFREWLLEHGLDPRNRDVSVIVEVYETLFANSSDPPLQADRLACGVGLRWFLLVALGYRGYPAYEFKYSCPQTLLTPYYLALRELGVEIHFFHEVTDLCVEGEGDARRLTGIRLRKQATVKKGPSAYDPFLRPQPPGNPRELPAWPSRPSYEQLVEGEQLRQQGVNLEDAWSPWPGVETVELSQGDDFDLCVLGIPLGALPQIAEGLVDPKHATAHPSWKKMVDGMALTQTVSMQLWMREPAESLYSGRRRGLLTGFAQPEPSQADFTHLLRWERWPEGDAPKFVAYHTGALASGHPLEGHPFSEHDYPRKALAEWKQTAHGWLAEHYAQMYDRAAPTFEGFLELLAVPPGTTAQGLDRLWAQYFNIGVQPSDLYVLSQPGTTRLRLGQGESGYANLVLCGDWTRTDLDCGCVEAATQSGMLCSRVISNEPTYVWHPGF